MICAACGYDNLETARFCSQCAMPLRQEILCPACGATNAADSKFCNQCARPLGPTGGDPSPADGSTPAPTATHPQSFSN